MNEIIFGLHNPEELRYLSNMFHWVIGYAFLGITLIAFLQLLGYLKSKLFLWPGIAVIVSSSTLFYLLLHHGLGAITQVWEVILSDPQQQQHLIMLILLLIGGIVELVLSTKRVKKVYWQMIWPIGLMIIGYMFLSHPQHGTAEAIAYTLPFHTHLGLYLVITGVLKMLTVLFAKKFKILTWGWIIGLLVISIMLISYSEPEGAYQVVPEHQEIKIMDH